MGMFDDLIPTAPSAGLPTAAKAGGMFDDLSPVPDFGRGLRQGALPAPSAGPPTAAKAGGMFDDLIPIIDFNRPIEAVRADIGKLQGPERVKALNQWADHFVANERASPWHSPGGVGMAIDNTVRTPMRGTFAGPFLDEVTAASQKALQAVSGGFLGSDYDEALAYQRARDRAVDEDYPIASTAGKFAGGVAGAIAALPIQGVAVAGGALPLGIRAAQTVIGGPLAAVAPAATMGGRILQGAGIGGAYGAASGFGNAEGGNGDLVSQAGNRLDDAASHAALGAGVGAVLPPIVSAAGLGLGKVGDAISPQWARISQNTRNAGEAALNNLPEPTRDRLVSILEAAGVRDRPFRSAGAAAAAPSAPISGAEAAADQVIANQLARANVSVTDLRQLSAQSSEAARFNPNSRAQDVQALVDLDLSLQRLGSSVARQQPEAGKLAAGFIGARQTGRQLVPLAPTAGLPTRPAFSRTGADDVPMGQFERVRDALRRAMGISDGGSHGFAKTAYRTDERIIDEAKREAKTLYDDVRKAGAGIDLQSTVAPVLQKWTGRTIDEIEPVAQQINQFMGFVNRALVPGGQKSHIERLDSVKQWMDNQIDKAYRAGDGYAGGVYTELKNDILKAVDAVKINDLGEIYAKARGAFSSKMEMRDALQLGRDVFKENSEVVVDQFLKLTPGQGKLSRLGLVDGFEQNMGRQKRTADITQMFETPRVQEILEAVIPRPRGATSQFANRPERFGQYLDTERRMIATRDEVLGNSKTAQRIADDKSLNSMVGMIDDIKRNPTAVGVTMRLIESTLDRLFGFRADTAAEIARKLFSADQAARDRLLSALDKRLGPDRATHFRQLLEEHFGTVNLLDQSRVLRGSSGAGPANQAPNQPYTPADPTPKPDRSSSLDLYRSAMSSA